MLTPVTDYIIDVTTADKAGLVSALAGVSGVLDVQDGGIYREDANFSQVHIQALDVIWTIEQLDDLLYRLNYDVAGIVKQERTE